MKAATIEKYGDFNEFILKELPDPVVGDKEVLIKIKAASVNPIDWKIRSGSLKYIYPIRFPAILGFDFSGEIKALGKRVESLHVGDAVYGCSYKKEGQAYSQLIALEETSISLKPETMDFKQAASIPLAAMTALQALRDKGDVKQNHRVLIIGASGGVGMFAVQIAKILGAKVSAVCSTTNVELVSSFGAEEVIDYKKTPPFSLTQNYDVIFDCVAAYNYPQAKKRLTKNGVYISTIPSIRLIFQGIFSKLTSKKAKIILLNKNKNDLETITQWINNNKLITHIDSEFSLQNISLAHQRSESLRTVGKIIIAID